MGGILILLARIGPWIARFCPWLISFFTLFGKQFGGFFVKFWTWLTGKTWFQFLAYQVSENAVRGVAVVAVQAIATVAYGWLLLIFWTWVSGTSFHEIFSVNPLVGAPAGALYLASHAFPLKFLFGSFIAFIQWRLTCIQAAIIFCRSFKYLLGA
jgi:hypothetical protein